MQPVLSFISSIGEPHEWMDGDDGPSCVQTNHDASQPRNQVHSRTRWDCMQRCQATYERKETVTASAKRHTSNKKQK